MIDIMRNSATENRKLHYDLLRILAAFSVVMLHSAAQFWHILPVTGAEWKIVNAYDACFRFGVPVFVMISGAVFLDPGKNLGMKKLYLHNILRLVIIYVLWSGIYGLMLCFFSGGNGMTWKQILVKMVAGQVHLWYLPMLVGIYMLLPVLRSWILHAEEENIRYFLALFVLLQILRTTVMVFVKSEILQRILELGRIEMVCSYLGYFVLGYYIAHVGIKRKYHKYLYLSVIPSAVLNILVSDIQTVGKGSPSGEIYDSYGLFTFLITVAIFLFFTEKVKRHKFGSAGSAVIREVSGATPGIYLVHIGIIDLLELWGIDSAMIPVAGVPVFAVLVFVLGYVPAALLRRIPVIGRYIC